MGVFHGSVLCFSATEDQQFLSNFWLQCWETQLAAIRVLQGLKPEAFVEGEERDTQTPQALKLFLLSCLSNLSKQIHENCIVSVLYLWIIHIFQRAFEVLQATDHQVLVRHCTVKRTIHRPWMDRSAALQDFWQAIVYRIKDRTDIYLPLFAGKSPSAKRRQRHCCTCCKHLAFHPGETLASYLLGTNNTEIVTAGKGMERVKQWWSVLNIYSLNFEHMFCFALKHDTSRY